MAQVNKKRRTLVVTNDKIVLGKGVSLPEGRYSVWAHYNVVYMMGRPTEHLGRVMLTLTRQQLIDFGLDLSKSTMLGVDMDVSAHVARKEAELVG